MTAFVLVPGHFTGGWIWREVGARLREAGAEIHPATLTGLGDRRHPAGPDTGLETHIEDLLRLIDTIDAPELVLVGHEYGIHPVLGAADRRPERIARIVYLDAGLPQDGDTALQSVPDQEVRARLSDSSGAADALQPVPPPAAPGDWQRWGSVAGLSAADLERLTHLAAPQPAGTLTGPLKLSGALAAMPMSGVFCTAGGVSTATVETMVASGLPQFRSLAEPRWGFFDLDTGHWPMLSRPGELADILLRAAAGEGRRVTAPAAGEPPAYLRPSILDTPEQPLPQCPRERTGRVDLYLPDADGPRPALLVVHGGPVPEDLRPTPRDWPAIAGYGRYAAGLGLVGATVDHRLHALDRYPSAAEDVAEAVGLLRADPRVDGDRIALWFLSAGGLLSADWLSAPPSWLRCVAASYPVLAPLPGWDAVDRRFRPVEALAGTGRLPIVLVRAGLENASIAATVDRFVSAAAEHRAALHLIDVPHGRHGFDAHDSTDEARAALHQATTTVLGHLRS